MLLMLKVAIFNAPASRETVHSAPTPVSHFKCFVCPGRVFSNSSHSKSARPNRRRLVGKNKHFVGCGETSKPGLGNLASEVIHESNTTSDCSFHDRSFCWLRRDWTAIKCGTIFLPRWEENQMR